MKRIGLISDTHGYLDPQVLDLLAEVDEVWHAGDIGDVKVLEALRQFKPLRAVWGNADDNVVRRSLDDSPRVLFDADALAHGEEGDELPKGMVRFMVEKKDVLMTHIGGYPGRYSPGVLKIMRQNPPDIFVAGHSHILKVIYDKKYDCLHLNPGACGRYGIQVVRTLLRFTIDGDDVRDMQVCELGSR